MAGIIVTGENGTIELNSTSVIINRLYAMGIPQPKNAIPRHVIPLSAIQSIQFREAALTKFGKLRIVSVGADPLGPRGANEIYDPCAVVFALRQQSDFVQMRNALEKALKASADGLHYRHQGNDIPSNSVATVAAKPKLERVGSVYVDQDGVEYSANGDGEDEHAHYTHNNHYYYAASTAPEPAKKSPSVGQIIGYMAAGIFIFMICVVALGSGASPTGGGTAAVAAGSKASLDEETLSPDSEAQASVDAERTAHDAASQRQMHEISAEWLTGNWVMAPKGGDDGQTNCFDFTNPRLYRINDNTGKVMSFRSNGEYRDMFAYTTPSGEEHYTAARAKWALNGNIISLSEGLSQDAFHVEWNSASGKVIPKNDNVLLFDQGSGGTFSRFVRCIGDTAEIYGE